MKGLTDKQQEMLDYIEEFMRREGMAPTVYEIADEFKIRSATAFAHLRALQRKGYVNRSSKARSLSIQGMARPGSGGAGLTLEVPVIGRVAAGVPLLAEEQVEDHIKFDPSLLPRGIGGHKIFALKVFGESMRDLGILDGDTIVAKQTDQAKIEAEIAKYNALRESKMAEVGRIRAEADRMSSARLLAHSEATSAAMSKAG
jgi:repressor LexA